MPTNITLENNLAAGSLRSNAAAANATGQYNPFFMDGGLLQEWLPYSQINANLQGWSSYFNNATPADHAAYSLAQFRQSQKPANDVVEFAGTVDYGKQDDSVVTHEDLDFALQLRKLLAGGINAAQGKSEVEKGLEMGLAYSDNMNKPIPEACKQYNNDGLIPWLTLCTTAADASKRVVLIGTGVLLLALGVWALR